MIMSGHPFIKALAAYWGGAFVQGLRCHFISMPGKSPMKLEVTSRHDHSCLLGRKASKQTNMKAFGGLSCLSVCLSVLPSICLSIYMTVRHNECKTDTIPLLIQLVDRICSFIMLTLQCD